MRVRVLLAGVAVAVTTVAVPAHAATAVNCGVGQLSWGFLGVLGCAQNVPLGPGAYAVTWRDAITGLALKGDCGRADNKFVNASGLVGYTFSGCSVTP